VVVASKDRGESYMGKKMDLEENTNIGYFGKEMGAGARGHKGGGGPGRKEQPPCLLNPILVGAAKSLEKTGRPQKGSKRNQITCSANFVTPKEDCGGQRKGPLPWGEKGMERR